MRRGKVAIGAENLYRMSRVCCELFFLFIDIEISDTFFEKKKILYFIIVIKLIISGTTAARGLKFWLQVALGPPFAPWGRRPDPDHPDPENPVFPDPDGPDPDVVLRERWGGPRATCSQNFRPLAALEAEITTPLTIIKHITLPILVFLLQLD